MFEVYCHTSPSGKRYVGYSGRRGGMAERWREHAQESDAGSDRLICRAIRKYGADSFRHELLTVCDTEAGAHTAERYWIAARATLAPAGYNATPGGDGNSSTRSPETCARISAAKRGVKQHPLSESHRAKISASWTPERRAARSIKSKANQTGVGRSLSAEHRARIGAAHRGKIVSQETRARMSAAQRARWEKKAGRP